ncbi:hypothetical protein [Actinopolymorpha pittospori]|uniref:Uncharacterized protein n=1 Tax=Actinopolymorpha pittospori TaxID=648752 RepID=A0A927N7D2_9ACTN|nr:hypothetical protein [Actinopolymorpha pittospori]MBE1612997.1 hypothetical protein [Actinopolymorpha pittospori]
MEEPTERESARFVGEGASRADPTSEVWGSRGQPRDSLVFCVSDGTGGFGGIYWLDDRGDRNGRGQAVEEPSS